MGFHVSNSFPGMKMYVKVGSRKEGTLVPILLERALVAVVDCGLTGQLIHDGMLRIRTGLCTKIAEIRTTALAKPKLEAFGRRMKRGGVL
jgi:hypothetical protein